MEKQPPSNPDFQQYSEAPPPYPGGANVEEEHHVQGSAPAYQATYPPPQAAYPPHAGAAYPPQYYPGQQHQQPFTSQPMATTTTVIVTAPHMLGSFPINMTCSKCHAQVVTSVQHESGLLTWLLCGGLALFGCWFGCCLIPFCVDECQDVVHKCPNCKAFIGSYRRL